MSSAEGQGFTPLYRLLLLLPILAGLPLLALLPIGSFSLISGSLFQYTFLLHLGLFAGCIALSLLLMIHLAGASVPRLRYVVVPLLVFVVAACVLQALLPITARDALIHHLAVPKWWIEKDAIVRIDWHSWSYYPMLLQLGYAGLLSIGMEFATPLYHLGYLLIVCSVVAGFVYQQTEDVGLGIFSYLLFLTLPICLRLGTTPLVDLGLVLYATVAFVYACKWADEGGTGKNAALCGAALGMAMGCKYNGSLFAFFFLSLIPVLAARTRSSFGKTVSTSIFVAVVALVLTSPWLVRNLFWTGNPVYPLFGDLFGTSEPIPGISGFKPLELRYVKYGETLWEYLATPLKMLFVGEDHKPQYYDGKLSPLLLLPIIALFGKNRCPTFFFGFFLCLSYTYGALFFSGPRIRYLAPLFGIGVILSIHGLRTLLSWLPAQARSRTLVVILTLHLIFSGVYLADLFEQKGTVNYFFGEQTESEYLAQHVSEYRLAHYVNHLSKPYEVTYLLFTGNRFYYYDQPVLSGGHSSADLLFRWLSKSRDAGDLMKELSLRDITYLAVHLQRTRQSFESVLEGKRLEVWNAFQERYLQFVQAIGPYAVYRVEREA